MAINSAQQLLDLKGRDVWSVSSTDTVFSALAIMADKNVGALPVLDNDKLVGIISERDYARKVVLKGKSSRDSLVKELMTAKVYYIEPDVTLENCMVIMTERRIRHLPVMEHNRLRGIVTIGDVVGQIISDQKVTIKELEKYISGNPY